METRDLLIRCMQGQEDPQSCAPIMLRTNDKYLPNFVGSFSGALPLDYQETAVNAAANRYNNPGTIFLMFATMSDEAQQYCAATVAEHLIRIDNPHYLGKFVYYCRNIAEIGSPKLDWLFSQNNLNDGYAERWMRELDASNREQLSGIFAGLKAAGKPIKSPDEHIILNRDGYQPQFIVLHSSGAATPISGVALHCMRQTGATPISAHFVVGRGGEVYQFVDLKDAAKTNGTSNDPNADNYYRLAKHKFFRNSPINANNFCVTIECVEFGRHGAIDTDSPEYFGILRTLKFVHNQLDIPIDEYHVIGHRDIAPRSKWFCPGDKFPLQALIQDYHALKNLMPVEPLNPEQLLKNK